MQARGHTSSERDEQARRVEVEGRCSRREAVVSLALLFNRLGSNPHIPEGPTAVLRFIAQNDSLAAHRCKVRI